MKTGSFGRKIGAVRNFASLGFWGMRYRFLGGACRSDVWGFPLNVERGDIVLEIGGGANPRVRSDIVLEKFWSDRLEGRKKWIDERPYLIGDGCNIPLRDKNVDYIICRHVLEHVEKPEAMLDDFQRVARKGGFISTPSRLKEEVTPARYHLWYVFHEGDTIVLEEKPAALAKKPRPAARSSKRYSDFEHEWIEGKRPLKYVVRRRASTRSRDFEKAVVDIPEAIVRDKNPNMRRKVLARLRKSFFRTTASVDLYSMLRCPVCKAEVSPAGNTFCCENQHHFPNVDSVPVLLTEAMIART